MKKDLRIKAKNVRKTLNIKALSKTLIDHLRTKRYYKDAQNIMIYYPLDDEIDLLDLMQDDKDFYLPRVDGKCLEVCPYKKGDEMAFSEWGVREPVCDAVGAAVLDLVIVPSLMTDKNNHRLGYGGGYYDRFLRNYHDITSVTLVAKELVAETLPIDEGDEKVNFVIWG